MANFNLGNLVWKITADSAQFQGGLKENENALNKFGTSLKSTGANLTKFLTVPLLGALGASVKFASDLQESTNAVNVTFGDSARIISAWGANAAEQAGLSTASFNDLATQVGVLLKTTGNDLDTVANDTINLTQRAADLASIYNTDVNDAVYALGAALRGEAEPARRYGVLLSEVGVQAKAAELGLGGLNGELTEAEKVQARYAIILESTESVAGDFARTNGDAANSLRVVKAQAVDLAADLGTVLLPVVADVLTDIRGWLSGLKELDTEQTKTIVGVGLAVAAIGPLATIIGTTITAVTALKTAMIALNSAALFGPLGLIAGVVAATVALRAFADARFDRVVDSFGDSLVIAAAEIGVTVEKSRALADAIRTVSGAFSDANNFGGSFNLRTEIEKVADSAGLTAIEFARILVVAPAISDALRQSARVMVQQADLSSAIEASVRASQRATTDQGAAVVTANEALATQSGIVATINNSASNQAVIVGEITNRWVNMGDTVGAQYLDFMTLEENYDRLRVENSIRERQRNKEEAEEKEAFDIAEADRIKKLNIDRLQTIKSAYDQINNIVGMAFDNEIALIEQSELSEEEKADKIAALKIKQAKYNKAATLAQIAIDTAGAIVKALPNVPLAILSGVLGAAQFAVAAATPLPTFDSSSTPSRPSPPANASPSSVPGSPSDTTARSSATGSTGGSGGGVVNFTQNNIVNLDTDENLGKAARILFPALQAEGIRRGETI